MNTEHEAAVVSSEAEPGLASVPVSALRSPLRPATPVAAASARVDAREVETLAHELDARLDGIAARHADVKLASSLAAEDMVLTHAILSRGVRIGIFTLDTGRLHAETLEMLTRIQQRYGYAVERFKPLEASVVAYIEKHGLNGFYDGIEQRLSCCQIRKVEPLNRALAGVQAWVTGQRREQSVTRTELEHEERDAARSIAKYNPLAHWSEAQVWAYLRHFEVPVNPLHARGYPSIGCEPCTRAIRAGEDSRAGRWWWESRDSKECGLHLHAPAPIESLKEENT